MGVLQVRDEQRVDYDPQRGGWNVRLQQTGAGGASVAAGSPNAPGAFSRCIVCGVKVAFCLKSVRGFLGHLCFFLFCFLRCCLGQMTMIVRRLDVAAVIVIQIQTEQL
jgi:hypothetical protein